MILTVLSNTAQYEALLGKYGSPDKIKILCDDHSFFDVLKKKKLNFEKIDEDILRQRWSEINSWSCEKALRWSDSCAASSFFDSLEIEKTLYLFFSYALASLVKNYLFAEYILNKYGFDEMIVFKFKPPPYPNYDGNHFLNNFLMEGCRQKGRKVTVIILPDAKERGLGIKGRIKRYSCAIQGRLSILAKGRNVYLVCGALNHLQPVITKIKSLGKKVVLLDFEYNLRKHIFAIRSRIRYYILLFYKKGSFKPYLNDAWKDRMQEMLGKESFFAFLDVDLTKYVWSYILEDALAAMKRKTYFLDSLTDLVNRLKPQALILDEDVGSNNSFLATFFKSRKIPVFCVSHGYMLINFAVSSKNKTFDLSTTFVNSEFEKYLYTARGWDPARILITGIPRYDRLLGYSKIKRKREFKMSILYVASSMLERNPRLYSYLGIHGRDRGDTIRQCLKDAITAVSDKDVNLTIKPHNAGEEPLWRSFVLCCSKNKNIKVASARTDFFKLLTQSDMVISSYWSTAINESSAFNIPVAVMDYYKDWGDLHPDKDCGLFEVAHNFAELNSIIQKRYIEFLRDGSVNPPRKNNNARYYLGECDGDNTNRVVDRIIKDTRKD